MARVTQAILDYSPTWSAVRRAYRVAHGNAVGRNGKRTEHWRCGTGHAIHISDRPPRYVFQRDGVAPLALAIANPGTHGDAVGYPVFAPLALGAWMEAISFGASNNDVGYTDSGNRIAELRAALL